MVSAVSGEFCLDGYEQQDNRLEELCEKLFAVHATNKLPAEGILYAGFGGARFTHEVGNHLYPNVRWTVHFALGELVRPVGDDWMNWENSPYAVVTPLKSLMPQLININCYDTFVLGNFKKVLWDLIEKKEASASIVSGSDLGFVKERWAWCVSPSGVVSTLRGRNSEIFAASGN